jgi:hypothetical protein
MPRAWFSLIRGNVVAKECICNNIVVAKPPNSTPINIESDNMRLIVTICGFVARP